MPELTQFVFSYKEVVEALIAKQGLTSGVWGLYIKFGIRAANIASPQETPELRPAAIIPILEIGLQKFEKENNLSVDASKLNQGPKPRTRRKPRGGEDRG